MSKNSQFEKFINPKKNSVVKEEKKQEKRAYKKQRAAAIDKRFEEKRKLKEEAREAKGGLPKKGEPKKTTSAPAKGAASKTASSKPLVQEAPLRLMPLNKFIAHSGVCSRRDAADVVKQGDVKVNNEVIKEPGYKVADTDTVTVKGKKIILSKDFIYILLNKPKDYITTSEDPEGRRTVMELIRQATTERVYPIGRLDRNTSGVLLFTNDGDLAQVLSHPKHEIKKIYEVKLDRPLAKGDFDKILKGLTLEDGFISPDVLAYADDKDKSVIGIEIHSGRNRIVRRIFEHLKYDVRGLDRVMYAGLTKKNVQRGNWRLLNEREIRTLKHFNKKEKSK
ncbi:MAG: rRNA pseudouridine synthase [Chitinophagaceae bacterium]|nr:rRNA pseudouridine synthase [Chitinophagaceae bacterium]